MAPSVGIESSTLLPAPRPLDIAMPTTTIVSLSATATTDGGALALAAPPAPGDASTALKLADCIGKVSAALAELGATVEALKGKDEKREILIINFTRYFLVESLGLRRGFRRGRRDCNFGGVLRLPSCFFSLSQCLDCDINDHLH